MPFAEIGYLPGQFRECFKDLPILVGQEPLGSQLGGRGLAGRFRGSVRAAHPGKVKLSLIVRANIFCLPCDPQEATVAEQRLF